jgi:hypothetical protein
MIDPNAARNATPAMRRCILSAVLLVLSRMRVATAAAELGIDETTVRRRRDREQAADWTLDELAVLLAYERDALGTRTLLDALVEADGRASTPVDGRCAESDASELALALASDLSGILRRLADQRFDRREAAQTADEIDLLVPLAQRAARTLRARATTTDH